MCARRYAAWEWSSIDENEGASGVEFTLTLQPGKKCPALQQQMHTLGWYPGNCLLLNAYFDMVPHFNAAAQKKLQSNRPRNSAVAVPVEAAAKTAKASVDVGTDTAADSRLDASNLDHYCGAFWSLITATPASPPPLQTRLCCHSHGPWLERGSCRPSVRCPSGPSSPVQFCPLSPFT